MISVAAGDVTDPRENKRSSVETVRERFDGGSPAYFVVVFVVFSEDKKRSMKARVRNYQIRGVGQQEWL